MTTTTLVTTHHLPSLAAALDDALLAWGSETAFIEADRRRERARWSARDVRREARRLCALLQSCGVEPGDRVALLMTNRPEWPISALATFFAGAVLVPLDYKLESADLDALIAHASPHVLVTEKPQLARLTRAEAETLRSAARKVVALDAGDADDSPAHHVPWEKMVDAPARIAERTRDDVATIVYSSGTGGRPKGCQLTHGNYLTQAEVLAQTFPVGPGKRFFSFLPTNHAIDFMCGFIVPLLSGATVIHQRTLRPEYLQWTMKRYRVTHMAVVPRLLSSFADRIRSRLDALPDWQRLAAESLLDLNGALSEDKPRPALGRALLRPFHDAFGGRLELIVAGGAFVNPEDAQLFQRIGIPVAIGYGLTEAGTVLTVNDLRPFRTETVGRPVRGVELQIHEPNEEGIGEVIVRSATVMRGYLDEPALTQEVLREGWLHTGDLGRLDEEGHLRLMGRMRNLIVTPGGKNVYPEDVESRFERVNGVLEHALVSAAWVWPDVKPERDFLVLIVRVGEDADPERVLADLRERNASLVPWRRAAALCCHEADFPRTASMKLKRGALAEALRAHHDAPTGDTFTLPAAAGGRSREAAQ